MHSAKCSTFWWCSNLQYPNIWSIVLNSRLHKEHLKDSIIIGLLFTEMLLVTFLLSNWSLFLQSVYYILYFRDGRNSLGIIILYQMIARLVLVFWNTRYSNLYYFLMVYPLNSYVGLLIFLRHTLLVAIPGCQLSFLFFYLTLIIC